jgi:hypothetical protein
MVASMMSLSLDFRSFDSFIENLLTPLIMATPAADCMEEMVL